MVLYFQFVIIMSKYTYPFSSPEQNAHVSYTYQPPSGVRPSVCPSSLKFSFKRLLLQNHWTDFNQIW